MARAAQEEADAEYAAALNAEEAQRAADASPPPPKRQQRRDLRLTAESTFRTLELLLVALDLRRGGARPDGNNCLLFALLQCAGRLHADQQGWAGVPTALDELRRVLHERCLDHDDLAGGRVGAAASWCEGWSRTRCRRVLVSGDFLGQAHIFAAADLLQCTVVVVEVTGGRARMLAYPPDYGASHRTAALPQRTEMIEITADEARRLRRRAGGGAALWLHLAGHHFSPLLTPGLASRMCPPPPLDLHLRPLADDLDAG